MDFFYMNFSTLFLEKHGNKQFNEITEQIKNENKTDYNEQYVEVIFKIAYLEFFGLNFFQIDRMIKDIMKLIVNTEKIKSKHQDSIKMIQAYLKSSMNEIIT